LEHPKTYQKAFYCVSCAVHRRIVKVRSHTQRRDRVRVMLKRRLPKRAEKPAPAPEARPPE
jgi:small subunit ribosomal protein S26e